jgi:hypothetical protein
MVMTLTILRVPGVGEVKGIFNHPDRGSFHKGDLFYGKVVDIKGNQITLAVGGERITATSLSSFQLNDTVLFQVKDNENNLLILQKVGGENPQTFNRDLSFVLQEWGIPDSPWGEKILSHLISKGLPLEKSLVREMVGFMRSLPDQQAETYLKVQTWLYAAGITSPNLQKGVFSLLFNNENALNLLQLFVRSYQAASRETTGNDILLLPLLLENLKEENLRGEEKILNQFRELLTSQRTVNESKIDNPRMPEIYYLPLPMQAGKDVISGEFYLVLKGKNREAFEQPLSLVISLNTEHMGKLWFHIKANNKELDFRVYTESPAVTGHIKNTWEELRNAVLSCGFRINSFSCQERSVTSVLELVDDLGRETAYQALDVRI